MNNNGKIKLELTPEEISILSNGLIRLIDNVYRAEKLTYETSVIKALDESAEIYQRLNQKICDAVLGMEWEYDWLLCMRTEKQKTVFWFC